MTEKEIQEQIECMKRVTAKATESREAAIKFLVDAGILNTIEVSLEELKAGDIIQHKTDYKNSYVVENIDGEILISFRNNEVYSVKNFKHRRFGGFDIMAVSMPGFAADYVALRPTEEPAHA